MCEDLGTCDGWIGDEGCYFVQRKCWWHGLVLVFEVCSTPKFSAPLASGDEGVLQFRS